MLYAYIRVDDTVCIRTVCLFNKLEHFIPCPGQFDPPFRIVQIAVMQILGINDYLPRLSHRVDDFAIWAPQFKG